jgi:hypothetical protein
LGFLFVNQPQGEPDRVEEEEEKWGKKREKKKLPNF